MHSIGSDDASLERSYQTLQPMEPATAGKVLRDAKQILDQFGVPFSCGKAPVSAPSERTDSFHGMTIWILVR